MWIIDNQLARRNINGETRNYLLGTRYSEEKKAIGENQYTNNSLNRGDHDEHPKKTANKIAEQSNVGQATVRRAAAYASAINTLVANTGIKRQLLLLGNIKASMKDIVELANKYPPEIQVKVIEKVQGGKEKDISNAIRAVNNEERDRIIKEQEDEKKNEV